MDEHFIKIMVLVSTALSIKNGLECTDVSLCIILFFDSRFPYQGILFTIVFRFLLPMVISMSGSVLCSTAQFRAWNCT